MERCVPNGGGRVVHGCGNPRIHVFDNIVQRDPYIIGKTIPVKALVYPCQDAGLEETRHAAEEAADRFKKMFQQNQ